MGFADEGEVRPRAEPDVAKGQALGCLAFYIFLFRPLCKRPLSLSHAPDGPTHEPVAVDRPLSSLMIASASGPEKVCESAAIAASRSS